MYGMCTEERKGDGSGKAPFRFATARKEKEKIQNPPYKVTHDEFSDMTQREKKCFSVRSTYRRSKFVGLKKSNRPLKIFQQYAYVVGKGIL